MATKRVVLSCWLVMTLGVAGASRAELPEADDDLLRSVFSWCGTTVWSENLFIDIPSVAPVATGRWPFEGTDRLLTSHFHSGSRTAGLRRYFEEHFDRDRMQRFHDWCDAEPAKSIVRLWIPASTLHRLRFAAYLDGEKDPKSRRWQTARRVARAQRAPELAEGIAAAWMEPFVEGLKEGFAQAGWEPQASRCSRRRCATRRPCARRPPGSKRL